MILVRVKQEPNKQITSKQRRINVDGTWRSIDVNLTLFGRYVPATNSLKNLWNIDYSEFLSLFCDICFM